MYAPNKPIQTLSVDQRSRKIEVGRITKDMSGQYIIEASNPYGSVKDYFYLTVNEGNKQKNLISNYSAQDLIYSKRHHDDNILYVLVSCRF